MVDQLECSILTGGPGGPGSPGSPGCTGGRVGVGAYVGMNTPCGHSMS